jgi:hypothetical protein
MDQMPHSFVPTTLVLKDRHTGKVIRFEPTDLTVLEIDNQYANHGNFMVDAPIVGTTITVIADFFGAFQKASAPQQLEERKQIGES